MAKSRKRSTKRRSTPIALVIEVLNAYAADGNLCAQGRERLRWWRANQRRFPSVEAALLTWSPRALMDFVDWLPVDPPRAYWRWQDVYDQRYTTTTDAHRLSALALELHDDGHPREARTLRTALAIIGRFSAEPRLSATSMALKQAAIDGINWTRALDRAMPRDVILP